MTDRRTTWTAIGAVTLALLGFVGGAVGSSWWSLDAAAKRWRKIRVEHQGVDGMTTRTKVIFDDAKVAVVGVELIRDPEGRAERAHVDVRGGAPVSLTMDERGVPIEVEGQDGSRALLTYSGTKVRATFSDTKGKALGDEVMSIPAPLRSPMKLAWSLPELELVGVAHAQASDAAEDRSITVSRDVALDLDVTMPATGTTPGEADVEVSCAPLTCIPLTPSIAVPGRRRVRIA
ncbi:MAG: hypothetical protein KC731_23595, partial [Myxococcales bacterium]|nr:hypothetical protein [Myxococcales bacterium]